MERLRLAFSAKDSGSYREESLGRREGEEEVEEFVDVGVRS